MKRKVLAMLLAMSMTLAGLAGCGSTGEKSGTESTTESTVESETAETGETAASEDNFNKEGYPIVNEPITLKVMLAIRDVDSMIEPNEMSVIQDLEKKTGIHIEWEVIKAADWDTKLNLMFASGEYPDILLAPRATIDIEEYGVVQQLLIPLDDLAKQYMPIYTERIAAEDTDPTIGLVASDGQRYSIGFLGAANVNTEVHYFINQTWLNNLGMDMPANLDELTEALRAFKTQDPNQNGEQDEIPLEMTLNNGYYGVGWMLPMFGVPADPNKWLFIDDNKKVQFAPTQEGFRKCVEWLHNLYEEGLIDPEMFSQDSSTVESKYAEGNIGFFMAYRLLAMGWDEGVTKDSVLYIPGGPEGTKAQFSRMLEIANNGACVTVSNEHIPETMRWLDSLLETETMYSLYYGAEGVGWEYDKENGKINALTSDTSGTMDFLNTNTLFFAPPKYTSETFNMLLPQRVEKTEYCKKYSESGMLQKYANTYLNMAPLTADQHTQISLLETDIKNAVNENMATFISSGVTDESWDTYIKLFENMKVSEYLKIYQDAIDQMELE